MLHLPNLGTNCSYPFKVLGFGGGLQAGISQIAASGAVVGLKRILDLTGDYEATQGEATVIAGAGATQMKNRANNVRISLASNTRGAALGYGAQGIKIEVSDPPVNAPAQYMMEFGFNPDSPDGLGRQDRRPRQRWQNCRFLLSPAGSVMTRLPDPA